MNELSYLMQYAGIPFLTDVAAVVRMPMQTPSSENAAQLPPKKHQPLGDLIDELNRLIDSKWLADFGPPASYPGKNLDALAYQSQINPWPNAINPIGSWYYPNTAGRWSVYRGLATSSMAKAMLAATGGSQAKPFVMKAVPIQPTESVTAYYTLQTDLYMLPPRPLAEHGGQYDGLYLITLVDERYYFQGTPASLRVTQTTTWANLISQLAAALGVIVRTPTIAAAYGQPEPDSQLWTNAENAAVLLDAVAFNIGKIAVRSFDGSYDLLSPTQSLAIVQSNRGNAMKVVRTAGGDLFNSGTNLKIGSLQKSKNAVIPEAILYTFPKYVIGNDPVPHFVNPRYANQRPSAWHEDSYGDTHIITVPIKSGGVYTSGLSGTSTQTFHCTAKALCSGDVQAASGIVPLNNTGLTSLALQAAQDYYSQQVVTALDEVYPGTFAWTPEGIHAIIWTFSERQRQAITRVMRAEWNANIREFQHATPALAGQTNTPAGVGGKSVAQSWRDSCSGDVVGVLGATLLSGATQATFGTIDNLPTQNRWRGQIESEKILFEGTSGGVTVGIVYRAIDGTLGDNHANGKSVVQVFPDITYGVNLVTTEKGQFVYPQEWTSGGIQGVRVVPQTQTVRVLSPNPQTLNGISHYSGEVRLYDASKNSGNEYRQLEPIWIVERNSLPVKSGKRYDGQFMGWSPSPVSPVYGINESIGVITSGDVPPCSGVFLAEKDIRCESGLLNIYQRSVLLQNQGPCLTRTYGDWAYLRNEGCCICSGEITSGMSGSVPTPCQSGFCTPYCPSPPYQWTVPVAGFQGNCQVFNRTWVLLQSGPVNCLWGQSVINGSLYANAALNVLSNTQASLGFSYGVSGSAGLFTANYVATLTSGYCCSILTFSVEDCSCNDSIPPPTHSVCNQCVITPATWSMVLSGFTGVYASFNGSWTLGTAGGCEWAILSGTVSMVIQIVPGTGGGRFLVTMSDSSGQPYATYVGGVLSQNCCSIQTCDLYVLYPGPGTGRTGNAPPAITVTPSCSDQGPSGCPDTLAAIPVCCDGPDPPPNPTFSCCTPPINLAPTLYVSFSGISTDCVGFAITVPIVYDSAAQAWLGHYTTCGYSATLSFSCTGVGVLSFLNIPDAGQPAWDSISGPSFDCDLRVFTAHATCSLCCQSESPVSCGFVVTISE